MTGPLRFVVVGAGHAGAAAAQELAATVSAGSLDGRVTVIDGDADLPYERPDLSKALLLADSFPISDPHDWAGQGITFLGGTPAAAIDTTAGEVELADGRRVPYDRLLLAPGGHPRALAVPGGERAKVLRHREDARHLHGALRAASRIVIIGAGVIGLEVASSTRALGVDVTVVEAGSRPMARSLPADISALLTARHVANGTAFRFGATVTGIAPCAAGGETVTLGSGEELQADLVLAGIGFEADTALAASAGIALDRGIVVDADGATSVPGIWAAGDATVFPDATRLPARWQTWQHARRHGVHVAQRMSGRASDYRPVHWFWTDQLGMNLQLSGHPLEADEVILRGAAHGPFTRLYLKNDRVVGAITLDQGRDNRPVTAMIESGQPFDKRLLSDMSVQLRSLKPQKAATA